MFFNVNMDVVAVENPNEIPSFLIYFPDLLETWMTPGLCRTTQLSGLCQTEFTGATIWQAPFKQNTA